MDEEQGEHGECRNILSMFSRLKIPTFYYLLCCRDAAPESNERGHEDVDRTGPATRKRQWGKRKRWSRMHFVYFLHFKNTHLLWSARLQGRKNEAVKEPGAVHCHHDDSPSLSEDRR